MSATGTVCARLTSSARGGALACVDLNGNIDQALEQLGVRGIEPGTVKLRRVPIDDGAGGRLLDDAVIGRWTTRHATVMLHGGRAIIDGFLRACAASDIATGAAEGRLDPAIYAEADDPVEKRMLAALSTAKSQAAIDLLLDQPRRWREESAAGTGQAMEGLNDGERARALNRLLEPALVVAVGPPNIGKSSLLNALAGRSVSAVADQAGTTRDHVGTLIDLAGVVVRWVDTPGLDAEGAQRSMLHAPFDADDEKSIQAEAQRLAREVAARADVLVVCIDRGGNGEQVPLPTTRGVVVKIGVRADLAKEPAAVPGIVASASVRSGTGLEKVVEAVREAVVPERFLRDGKPWMFWQDAMLAQ